MYSELIIGKRTWSTVANNVRNILCDEETQIAILACSLPFESKQKKCEHFFLLETGK